MIVLFSFFCPFVCIYFCNVLNGQSVSFIIIAFCLYVKKIPNLSIRNFFVLVTFLLFDRFLISVCFYKHSCILLSASQVEHLDQEYPAHSIVCYHGYKVIHRSDQRPELLPGPHQPFLKNSGMQVPTALGYPAMANNRDNPIQPDTA